jgi:uncharacterized membrane protein YfcA
MAAIMQIRRAAVVEKRQVRRPSGLARRPAAPENARAMEYLFVLVVGLGAGTLGGVIGTGSSIVLMPVLVILFGPRQAVPIMAIAALMGNAGRVIAWWSAIDWRACLAYCTTAVPGAVLGASLVLAIPPGAAELALGVFFLALIPVRHWLARRSLRLSRAQLALLGAPLGLLTGLVVSTGPLTVPLFTFHGLERGALLGTEAAASIGMYGSKVAAFQALGALPLRVVLDGLIVGSSLMAGSFIGRAIVLALTPGTYRALIDGLMLCSGLALLWAALR